MARCFVLLRKTNGNDRRIEINGGIMIDTQDTRFISLNEPIPEGMIKILEDRKSVV